MKIVILFFLIFNYENLFAQENTNEVELYGFIMTDAGYNFNSINPDWFDVMRITKLPSFKDEFAPEGNVFFGLRQTRFGIKSNIKTKLGRLKTQFDFDLFGVGKDAGQTTFHVVNAYGQLGDFGAGQTASALMNFHVFPVTLDYWGPSSRVFFLNLQFFYHPVHTNTRSLKFSLERPGGSADGGEYEDRIELQSVRPFLNVPNFVFHYKHAGNWGHAQLAGIIKSIKWRDVSDTAVNKLSGGDIGWGTSLSTVINLNKNIKLKMQAVIGEGIQNYLADAPADIGLEENSSDTLNPLKGKAIPVAGFFLFTEINWTGFLRSSMGYSLEKINNTNKQSPNAFRMGQYGLMNLRYYPGENIMVGMEYQFGRRDNFKDGFHYIDNKIQFSFKYNYSNIFKW